MTHHVRGALVACGVENEDDRYSVDARDVDCTACLAVNVAWLVDRLTPAAVIAAPPARAMSTLPFGASLAEHVVAMTNDVHLRCVGIAPDGSARVALVAREGAGAGEGAT